MNTSNLLLIVIIFNSCLVIHVQSWICIDNTNIKYQIKTVINNNHKFLLSYTQRKKERKEINYKFILQSSLNDNTEAIKLKEQADKLRKEIAIFEQQKNDIKNAELQKLYKEQEIVETKRERYSAIVPILKPNGQVYDEECYFSPKYNDNEDTSYILTLEAPLPLGLILGESDEINGTINVDDITEGSNGQSAGILKNDIIRACTACRIEMSTPTWQLIIGGIGQPKTVRFMYSIDNQPFNTVIDAIGSNRMDPNQRPVFLVIERRTTTTTTK